MAPTPSYRVLLQNVWLTWTFLVLFLLVIVLSGVWLRLLLACVIASVASFLYHTFVCKLRPVPPNTGVLVTGCSSGIGEDAALRLLRCGFLVFATVRKWEDADNLKSKADNSSKLVTLLCDVTNAEHITAAVDAVKQRLQQDGAQLLGLVCNAGSAEFSAVELLPLAILRAQLETNVLGAVATVQAFLPLLRAYAAASPSHGARIVLVTSVTGRMALCGNAAYSASKHALEAVADSLRVELRNWRIAVTVLEPGMMRSRFNHKTADTLTANLTAAQSASKHQTAVLESYSTAQQRLQRVLRTVPLESPQWCSDAIELAMLDSHPQPRLLAGWSSLVIAARRLPAELLDRILSRDFS